MNYYKIFLPTLFIVFLLIFSSDSYSQYSISGCVTYSDNSAPVINDTVFILYYNFDQLTTVYLDSSVLDHSGKYRIQTTHNDSVLVCVGHQDEIPSEDHVQTFYKSTIDWQKAQKVYPADNPVNINISVQRIIQQTGNTCISGTITTLDSNNAVIPLCGATVVAKSDSTFKDAVITDSNGNYSLDSLSNGTYTVLATKIGYRLDSTTITTNGNSIISNHPKLRLTRVHTNKLSLSSRLTNQFRLYQNYPNPFNPSTKIKFDVPSNEKREMSNVKLKIYDILGNELTTLVNEKLQPGLYEVTWDASRYASGVYIYKLIFGSYSQAKRMIIIK